MPDPDDRVLRVPVIEETATVNKVAVQTDTVRVSTSAEEREVTIEDSVSRETFKVERVPMDHAVDVAPPPREKGSTTIISLVEERLVIEKRLFVVEEIHITREQTQERVAIPVTLRSTRATIERPSSTDTAGSTTDA